MYTAEVYDLQEYVYSNEISSDQGGDQGVHMYKAKGLFSGSTQNANISDLGVCIKLWKNVANNKYIK